MLILALESSAKPVSVAVYQASDAESCGKLLGQSFQNNGFSHSRTLMPMAEALLKNLELNLSDIGLIAVAGGPGSFTGVRIGVSAAKGLAWGLDVPVCGVSTLEAMAYQTQKDGAIICPVMDARRQQVYNALFEWQNGTLLRHTDDRAISLENFAEDLRRYSSMPVILVGDGAEITDAFLKNTHESEAFSNCHPASELQRCQTALGVALAALNSKQILSADLEPSYLRPSQAERMRSASSH